MKKIDIGHYEYDGYDVYHAPHPKLSGMYEIYKGEKFISRACSLDDAKSKVDNLNLNKWVKNVYNINDGSDYKDSVYNI